jgi:hypothetical protein
VEDGDLEDLKTKLKACSFVINKETNITQNVLEALKIDTVRRESLINAKIPVLLRKSFQQFAGTEGTDRFNSFANGKYTYWSFILTKSTEK